MGQCALADISKSGEELKKIEKLHSNAVDDLKKKLSSTRAQKEQADKLMLKQKEELQSVNAKLASLQRALTQVIFPFLIFPF